MTLLPDTLQEATTEGEDEELLRQLQTGIDNQRMYFENMTTLIPDSGVGTNDISLNIEPLGQDPNFSRPLRL